MTAPELLEHAPAVPGEWQLALAQAVVALAVAFGAPLDGPQQLALVSFSALAFSGLVAGGVTLRRSRLRHLSPALTGQVSADVIDAVLEALQVRSTPPASSRAPRTGAVVRQLETVTESGAQAAAAQAENDPHPPPPGTYPTDDEPGPDEPTGS